MKELTGRTVFITGGAQGIGFGIARAFARAGARIALADVDAEMLGSSERALAEERGDPASVAGFRLDVTDREGWRRVVDEAEERLGPIAVLCNNAGVGSLEPISPDTYEQWDRVLGINLGGVVNGIQTVLPRMVERGGPGHIVNTSSGAGLVGTRQLRYVTSKFAVVGMSESLRLQPALTQNGIGVSVLCPGLVSTAVIDNTARGDGLSVEDERVARATGLLQQEGLDPDTVGEQVLDAVRSGALYIYTDRYVEPLLRQRMELLLDAFPPATDRDRRLDVHARQDSLTPDVVGADR